MSRSNAAVVSGYVLGVRILEDALAGEPEEAVLRRLTAFWCKLGEAEPESLGLDTLAAARLRTARAVPPIEVVRIPHLD